MHAGANFLAGAGNRERTGVSPLRTSHLESQASLTSDPRGYDLWDRTGQTIQLPAINADQVLDTLGVDQTLRLIRSIVAIN
jgi:hypothetical protein